MPSSFSKINDPIQKFLALQRNNIAKIKKPHWVKLFSDALFCGEDLVRNKKFFQAIKQSLKQIPNPSTVVDAGSGSGILGIFALYLGAKKCYFLEQNPYSLKMNQKLCHLLGYQKQAIFIPGDAKKQILPEKYNLLISETISSGFVREDFPAIINNLKKYGEKNSIIIPENFVIQIIEKDINDQYLAKHQLQFSSQKDFKKQTIKLKNKNTYFLEFITTACLFDNIYITPGSCLSFLNNIKINLNFSHPLFKFIIS